MRRLLPMTAALLFGCNAALAQVSTMGTTAMGLTSTPGTIVTSPLNGPSPFSATTQPGAPDTTLAAVPLTSDPTTPGTVVTCSTPTAQITPGTPAVPVASLSSMTGTTGTTLFYVCKWKHGPTRADAVRTTRFIIHVRFSRLDDTGSTAARNTSSAVAFHYSTSSDLVDYDNVTGRGNCSGAVGDHSHADRHHHDRERRANAPAWQSLDYRVQLCTGRSAD
jgi:hypothetical protein